MLPILTLLLAALFLTVRVTGNTGTGDVELYEATYSDADKYFRLKLYEQQLRTSIARQEALIASNKELINKLSDDSEDDVEDGSTPFLCEPRRLDNTTASILSDTLTGISSFTGAVGPVYEMRRNFIEIARQGRAIKHSHVGWPGLSLAGSSLFLTHVIINPDESPRSKAVNAVPPTANAVMQTLSLITLVVFYGIKRWRASH